MEMAAEAEPAVRSLQVLPIRAAAVAVAPCLPDQKEVDIIPDKQQAAGRGEEQASVGLGAIQQIIPHLAAVVSVVVGKQQPTGPAVEVDIPVEVELAEVLLIQVVVVPTIRELIR